MKWILHPFKVLFVVEIHLHNHFQLHHETLLSHWLKVNQLLVGTCNSDIPAALAISRIEYLPYLHVHALYICKSFEYTFLIHNFESLDRFVLTFNTYAIFIPTPSLLHSMLKDVWTFMQQYKIISCLYMYECIQLFVRNRERAKRLSLFRYQYTWPSFLNLIDQCNFLSFIYLFNYYHYKLKGAKRHFFFFILLKYSVHDQDVLNCPYWFQLNWIY